MALVLGAATGWLLFAALVACLGSLGARFLILPRLVDAPAGPGEWLAAGSARQGVIGAALLVVALGLVFVRQLVEFHGPFASWGEDAHILLADTAWGITWHFGLAGAVVALGGFVAASRSMRAGWVVAAIAVLGPAAFPAFTGHANTPGPLRPLTLAADTLHVIAAGAWVGGLGFVLYSERSWRSRSMGAGPESLLPELVPAFSPVAMASVGTLALTGVFAAWMRLPAVSALWTTPYGSALFRKLVLVVAVLSLGLLNWKKLTPRLGGAGGRRALSRAASTELLLAHVVLFLTAILVTTPPPGE